MESDVGNENTLDIDPFFDGFNLSSYILSGNNFCPPYPECIENYVGNQDTSECIECLDGDINGDSSLNILDLVSISNLILDNGYDECSDINSDGELNILDLVTLVNIILGI